MELTKKNIPANPALKNGGEPVLSKDLFVRYKDEKDLHDQAFETKPVSYLADCFKRFAKNKASIVAAVIIFLIALYAIIVPLASPRSRVDSVAYPNGYMDSNFSYVLPYNSLFKGTGFWDGTKVETKSENDYQTMLYGDSNHSRFVSLVSTSETRVGSSVVKAYKVRIDTYAVGNKNVKLSAKQFEALTAYEKAQNIYRAEKSIMKPLVDVESYLTTYEAQIIADGVSTSTASGIIDFMRTYYNQNSNVYFALSAKTSSGKYSQNRFSPVLDSSGKPVDIYKRDTANNLVYEELVSGEYSVRVDYFDYATYRDGFQPYFFFGTNDAGQDIFLRLAKGTQFSLLLGIGISAINFIIGLIWGAMSGYYGGTTDLIMERITDIIANIPSIIILSICSIQFTNNVSLKAALGESGIIVLAFLVAFVYSGWVGVASTTRMQFYRFKGQEYVLASRTLGAKDGRLIFKHILPNAIGTLVTSSVLMIPGVIFSESSLSYLGIINFSTSGLSSIGSLLNEGQAAGLQYYPHVLLFPCIIISLLMISFNLFGNGLRDAFNTSLKGSED
jgi:oligopeptide transport system permease protein